MAYANRHELYPPKVDPDFQWEEDKVFNELDGAPVATESSYGSTLDVASSVAFSDTALSSTATFQALNPLEDAHASVVTTPLTTAFVNGLNDPVASSQREERQREGQSTIALIKEQIERNAKELVRHSNTASFFSEVAEFLDSPSDDLTPYAKFFTDAQKLDEKNSSQTQRILQFVSTIIGFKIGTVHGLKTSLCVDRPALHIFDKDETTVNNGE